MKRRILAAILAVAMAVTVFAGVTASAEEKEVAYSQDFEGTVDAAWDGFSVVADPLDATNKVVSHTDNSWGQKTSGFILENCDASQVYTIKLDVYGDAAHIELVYANNWDQVEMTDGTTTAKGIVTMSTEHYAGVHVRPLANQWDTVAVKFSGATQYKFYFMTQPGQYGVNGGTVLLDNIEVYKGDVLTEVNEEIQAGGSTSNPNVPDQGGNSDNIDDGVAGILCIGDSITHGNGLASSYFTSYRYPLWKKLIDAGVSFEMVGPREGNFNTNCTFEEYQGQTFVNKHYAQYGVTLEAMKGTIGAECANVDFDVAIINLGTNDRKTSNDTEIAWTNENIPNWLAEMTNTLRTINPNVTVFLAGLNDNWPGTLNGCIKAKAEEISTTDSPVYYIPAPTGWIADPNNANAATLDWVHPNEKGDNMMADTYYEALMENYFNAEPPVEDEPTPDAPGTDDEPGTGNDAVPTPGVEGTAAPTVAPTTAATPSAIVTTVPTATATATATPEPPVKKKVTIKFKKKKVTIKKGKKKVLKVTLKNAKKAKFSVNKKGKKVVKLSKKKAKKVTVKGKKKGKATITAKAAGKKAKCKVTVK